jgi:RHS repeat-associated protein
MARRVRVEFPGAFYHLMANNNTRTLVYGHDSVGNRAWVERDGPTGDAFAYDLNDQMTAGKLNISSPDQQGAAGSQTISYDANGNRVAFGAYGSTDTYTSNNLNQYTQRNLSTATYDATGNLKIGLDASSYTYDAQNRLLSAANGGTTETFTYDGLNRQVSRTINHAITYNVYDGWELIGEYAAGANTPSAAYVSGASGLVKSLTANRYYYQDASGSTSHLADSSGNLLEWYRYDLQGTPIVYNSNGVIQTGGSNYGIRHLFTGQQWYSELGLYDLRNRYYSPDIGRFLQADPSGFNGDATNLYRYCGNNPLTRSDPSGTRVPTRAEMGDALDIGYHGGDGTGSVGWGLTGYDWSYNDFGMLLTDQYYSMYNVSYSTALAVNGYRSIGGMIVSQPIPKAIPVGPGDESPPQGSVTAGPTSSVGSTSSRSTTDSQGVDEGQVTVGEPVGIVEGPPTRFDEAYNPTGRGWVYGWQGSYYNTFGAEAGWQYVAFANGQSAYYVYAGGGGGWGGPGVGYYEGTVSNVTWPSNYAGGFVTVQLSPGVASSISPDNGASSSVNVYGSPGASLSASYYSLQAVWWGGH